MLNQPAMITIDERIARTERLLRRLEEDQPYLRARLSALGAEHRQSAHAFHDRMRAEAEAELARQRVGQRRQPVQRVIVVRVRAAVRRVRSRAESTPGVICEAGGCAVGVGNGWL